jgi:hypothetical protein
MKKIIICILAPLIFLSSIVNAADFTVKKYRDVKAAGGRDWESMKIYVTGVGDGVFYANITLEVDHMPRLFCVPPLLTLYQQNYLEMLDSNIGHYTDDQNIDAVLVIAFQNTFPCNKSGT